MNTHDSIADLDPSMHILINDYVEDILNDEEKRCIGKYMSRNDDIRAFVKKSERGKQLAKHFYRVAAADDFEEKLFAKICKIKQEEG